MLLSDLVETSSRLAATRSRLEKSRLLADLLRRARGREIEVAVDYLSGTLPQGRLGVGWAMLERAHAAAGGEGAQRASLALAEVDAAFERVRAIAGSGSQEARIAELASLLRRATPDERSFLTRLVGGELRQGALEGVMEEAIVAASGLPKRGVRHAVMVAGSPAAVARAALEQGAAGLDRFAVRLFQPVQPMLAQTCDDLEEGIARLGRAALEHKLDGARVQVHRDGREVAVYSRSLRDVTASVPEVVEAALRLPGDRMILDGETLALRSDGRPQPFQVTMRRYGRKLDVAAMRAALPLSVYFFDLLHHDGEDLLAAPAVERFARMDEAVPEDLMVPRRVTSNADEAAAFLAAALERGHEGIMAKDLESAYEAGGRGRAWLKIKRAHTLDLVVLAAEWGHGRRQGWLSNLHLGARDAESGAFVMLGKTFKGLTDDMLEWQTRRLLELETSRDRHTVQVTPSVVVEIAFSDVQESPRYPGGLALRLARVKSYRPDKGPEDADTFDRVRAIWQAQTAREIEIEGARR
ncbi:MAG TPA: ATP-dependent DNA ligase [Thermoanaerobaculia bacterium]|nr:ATP-dependent DNA ligase [Thermoanaerobaculia bacterium]